MLTVTRANRIVTAAVPLTCELCKLLMVSTVPLRLGKANFFITIGVPSVYASTNINAIGV